MIKKMHESIKAALFAESGVGEFHTLLSGKIYDTIGPPRLQGPFAVWSMEGVTIHNHHGGDERLEANIGILVVTDLSKGVTAHLSIIDALSEVRNYTATVNADIDRLSFHLVSIGEVQASDKQLFSRTIIRATSTRI